MAFNVRFYTFQKRTNSTKQVTSDNEPLTLSCVLKDNTDIINPTLVVHGGEYFNPWNLNYCWVYQFRRYYFVNTWRYIVGQWECDCIVDTLATQKSTIGAKTKYVLRSASKYNRNIVDDFYPSLAWQPNYEIDTATFNWARSFDYGVYILGVVNNDNDGIGAMTYYQLPSTGIRDLVSYMLPQLSDWLASVPDFTNILYRSIYDPFSYIKSCKWFPISYTSSNPLEIVRFGNYYMNETGHALYARRIDDNINLWYSDSRELSLPSYWLTQDAKYRVNPYAHLYLICNPWGVIELNPLDFTDVNPSNGDKIKVYVYADFISGEGILKVYKKISNTEKFITQKSTKISVDVNLSQTSVDVSGILGGLGGVVGGIAAIAGASSPLSAVTGAIMTEGGVNNASLSAVPTLSGSIGQSFDCAVAMDGELKLVFQNCYFADEDNAENGKPLCENTQINTLSGYIKCLDGDIDIAGCMKQELDIINEHLTNGFFYE